MTKIFMALALSTMISAQSVAAPAPRCQTVFIDANAARLELQNILWENYDLEASSLFQKMILKYSARRLHKTLGGTAQDLKESVVLVDRWIQIAESLGSASEIGTYLEKDWVRREVLTRSVQDIMHSYGYEAARGQRLFKKIFSHRAVRFLLNPGELPFVADRPVPPEILERMFREGPEAVHHEIQAFYQSQGQYRVDAYRGFAKMYKWVALTVFAILAWDHFEESQEKISEEQKLKLTKSLEDLDEMLSVLDEEFARRGLYKN